MKEYFFTLTDEEVKIIGAALVELPFKVATGVIATLQRQIDEQDSPPPPNTELQSLPSED